MLVLNAVSLFFAIGFSSLGIIACSGELYSYLNSAAFGVFDYELAAVAGYDFIAYSKAYAAASLLAGALIKALLYPGKLVFRYARSVVADFYYGPARLGGGGNIYYAGLSAVFNGVIEDI